MKQAYIAFDLGATSGRTILATIENGKLNTEVINRFPHKIHLVGEHYHWNIIGLFESMLAGLSLALEKTDADKISIGVDTWAVDTAFLSPTGEICLTPYAYRDLRTVDVVEKVFDKISQDEIYSITGIQTMHFNTLFQLYEISQRDPALVKCASKMLFISDLFNYLLCGIETTDITMASTSQMFDPASRTWSDKIIDALVISKDILPLAKEPGVELAPLRESIAKQLGSTKRDIRVSLVAGHDTASAIVAIPSPENGTMFISSGTWSIAGIVTSKPILSELAKELNFSNEQGIFGTTRFLKNITGMWLLEECRKEWERMGEDIDYKNLFYGADKLSLGRCILDPNAPCFDAPQSMLEAIKNYAIDTNQFVPKTPAEFTRVILDSLAHAYNNVLAQLKELAPFDIKRIHIIGGGSRLDNLNQLIANITGLDVFAGPSEATAIGNILMQAYASGEILNIHELKEISKNSCDIKQFKPCH